MNRIIHKSVEIYEDNIQVIEFELSDIPTPFRQSTLIVPTKVKTPIDKHKVKETWHMLTGYGNLFCNEQEYEVKQGDVVYFSPGDTHSIYNKSSKEMRILSTWWE